MKNKILSIALSLMTALVLFLVAAVAPQPASATWNECPQGVFCAWSEPEATGVRYQYPFSAFGSGACINLANDATYLSDDNNWSSAYVGYQNGYNVRVFGLSGCFNQQGNYFTTLLNFPIYQVKYAFDTYNGGMWNNVISAFIVTQQR